MVETDQAGFHVSGWKSLIDKHNLKIWGKKYRYLEQAIVKMKNRDQM